MDARSLPLPRLAALRFAPPRATVLRRALYAAAVAAVLATGWLWLRDSSVVAVEEVRVTGVSGSQAALVRSTAIRTARDMTTLHVRPDELRKALAPYPIVRDVTATPDVPHGLRVHVEQYVPVGVVITAGERIPVAADGTLLRGARAARVPALPLRRPPAGDRLTGSSLGIARVIAAAPVSLRAASAKAFLGPRGLTVRLRAGTALYFGSAERLAAKWAAATAVLADPSSRGMTTLDLRVPERPAAGGLEPVQTTTDPNATTTTP